MAPFYCVALRSYCPRGLLCEKILVNNAQPVSHDKCFNIEDLDKKLPPNCRLFCHWLCPVSNVDLSQCENLCSNKVDLYSCELRDFSNHTRISLGPPTNFWTLQFD